MTIEKNTPNTLFHEDGGFTTVLNETLNGIHDQGALGIYCYLSGRPPGWNICIQHLMNHFDSGRDKIKKQIKVLQGLGLYEKSAQRDSSGKIVKWVTILRRKPTLLKTRIVDKNQVTENPATGESSAINKRTITIKENINIYSESEPVEYQDTYYPKPKPQKPKAKYGVKDMMNDNPHNIPQELLQDYKTVRDTRRSPITKTSWTRLNNAVARCAESGHNKIEVFSLMVENGWLSLNPANLAPPKKQTKPVASTSPGWLREEMQKKRHLL